MKKLLLIALLAFGFAETAFADWTGKDASGTTITFANPNTCSSVACIPTAQLVNASGSTLLGTAGTANAGVLTVQGIASMTPLLATLSGTNNLNNISGTISLPTGASTAAKQPALGTAGSASTDVITVQGIASMTALQVSQATAANLNATVAAAQATVSAGNAQNGVTANGNGTAITVTGYGAALFNVNCSVNCSGGTTINFEALDVVGTAFAVGALPVTGVTTAVSSVTNQSGAAQFCVPNMGYTSMRGRVSAYSAGTISVTITPINAASCDYAQVVNALSVSNASSAVATSSTNAPTVAYLYAFNGTTWDQLQDDGSKNLKVVFGASNQSVNVAQVAGTTTDTNSGNKSAGTQRNVLATDQVAIATWGQGATGAAAPSGATQMGVLQSGATGGFMKGQISCDNHVFKHITSATDTLAVQGVASQTIYVCSWRSRAAGVATWFLENTASANANCASTLTQITGVATEAANTGETWGSAFWSGLKNTSGNGLCINSTGTGGVDVDIWYTQF